MQVLNGNELEQIPHMIISFGGGMGGYSYHYRYVNISSIEGGVVSATGFAVKPALIKAENIFALKGNMLYCFKTDEHASRELRDEIRDHLLKGSLDKARKAFLGYNKAGPLQTLFIEMERQSIRSCGNWTYIGLDTMSRTQDYVICSEENFCNEPVVDEKDDMPLSFRTLEHAKEHFDGMVDNTGLYIVRRTEEIVYAPE